VNRNQLIGAGLGLVGIVLILISLGPLPLFGPPASPDPLTTLGLLERTKFRLYEESR